MNDFTREELQIIHLDMTTYILRTPILNESPSHKALIDKVERMIDNYCEHESLFSEGTKRHRCKCGEWFYDNQ